MSIIVWNRQGGRRFTQWSSPNLSTAGLSHPTTGATAGAGGGGTATDGIGAVLAAIAEENRDMAYRDAVFLETNAVHDMSDNLKLGTVTIGTAGSGGNILTLAELANDGTATDFAEIDTEINPTTLYFGGLQLAGLRATLAGGVAAKVTISFDG